MRHHSQALLPALIVGVYLVLSLVTLYNWHSAGLVVTGDEPHYLVITRGIVVDHTLEQTAPYREAFAQGLFLGNGITDAPSPANTHAYLGPHGLFNIHSFGLPFLLAIPYAVHGVTAVKVFLVLIGAVGVGVLWKISGVFTAVRWVRGFAVAAVALTMPLLSGAGQIFPDIPAGVLCLIGLYWLLTIATPRPLWLQIVFGLAVGYLPLLQIKYAAPALVLVVALSIALYRHRHRFRDTLAAAVPFVVLLSTLFAFNEYAFANLTGPYEPGAFQFGLAPVMVFFGLALDQGQGMLFQNLLGFVGLVGVGLLFAWRRWFAVAWVIVVLALVVPNSLLANQYGGYSFTGRFEWSATLVFDIAVLFALSRLAALSRVAFGVFVGLGLAVQAAFYAVYTFSSAFLGNSGRVLYNRGTDSWLQNYSFYFPIQNWLPALFDSSWSFGFLPNYAWGVVVLALLAAGFVIGFRRSGLRKRVWMPAAAAIVVFVVVAGAAADPPAVPRTYPASQLQIAQGSLSAADPPGQAVVVSEVAHDSVGIVTYGPITLLRSGSYRLSLTYSSSADSSTVVGAWQPVLGADPPLWNRALSGTNGQLVTVTAEVSLSNWVPASLQVQTIWNGTGQLGIHSLEYAVQ